LKLLLFREITKLRQRSSHEAFSVYYPTHGEEKQYIFRGSLF
jgi:hypothetical protein